MSSVLEKTIQSLEAALRYNPHNAELKASLAEAYIRSGRLDERTAALCESAMASPEHADNTLLNQIHQVRLVLEQVDAIEEDLAVGMMPPESETLEIGIGMLSDFIKLSPTCQPVWIALTRLQLLAGKLGEASEGITRLKQDAVEDLPRVFRRTLHYLKTHADESQREALLALMRSLGDHEAELEVLETSYDSGESDAVEALWQAYSMRYDPADPGLVPEQRRMRLLGVAVKAAPEAEAELWKASAQKAGWPVNDSLKLLIRQLTGQGAFEECFRIAKGLPLDEELKELLNDLSEELERQDEYELAVQILRYINENELVADHDPLDDTASLEREAALSMAEYQVRNGRHNEALRKYITALCADEHNDPEILEQIDGLLEEIHDVEIEPLVELGAYFRRVADQPKAVYYFNQALARDPEHPMAIEQLESLFNELLDENPNLPEIRLELGQLYLKQGRTADAVDQLTIAAASPAILPRANRFLAEIYYGMSDWLEAYHRFESISLRESDAELLYRIYQGLRENEALREAMGALELIQRIVPGYRDVMRQLGDLRDQLTQSTPSRDSSLLVDPKMKELVGDLAIGRYEYIEKLGSGGMGVVHKVFDLRNNMPVAMKILRDSLSSSSKALDRFFREARIAASIKHRNIVAIHDYNISNISGQSYIAMELVEGPSLREIVDRQFENGPVVSRDYITEMLYYGAQVCDALAASHERGIIHRDIKPDNILISSEGVVKITDFGIVHIEEATFTPTGAMIGTPRYMAPEQVTGGKIDGRSDIYSTGILLYEVLVGSPPFMTGDISYQQVNNTPLSPREVCGNIPESTSKVLLKCLEKEPGERYQTAIQLKLALLDELDMLGGCKKYQQQLANATIVDGFEEDDQNATNPGPNPQGLELGGDLDLDETPSPVNASSAQAVTPFGSEDEHNNELD